LPKTSGTLFISSEPPLLKNPGSAPDMHDQNLNYKFNLTSKIGSSVVVDLLVLQTLSSLTRLSLICNKKKVNIIIWIIIKKSLHLINLLSGAVSSLGLILL
jgi:hypothetical protein